MVANLDAAARSSAWLTTGRERWDSRRHTRWEVELMFYLHLPIRMPTPPWRPSRCP